MHETARAETLYCIYQHAVVRRSGNTFRAMCDKLLIASVTVQGRSEAETAQLAILWNSSTGQARRRRETSTTHTRPGPPQRPQRPGRPPGASEPLHIETHTCIASNLILLFTARTSVSWGAGGWAAHHQPGPSAACLQALHLHVQTIPPQKLQKNSNCAPRSCVCASVPRSAAEAGRSCPPSALTTARAAGRHR